MVGRILVEGMFKHGWFFTPVLCCVFGHNISLAGLLPSLQKLYQGVARYTVNASRLFTVQSGPMTRQVPSKRFAPSKASRRLSSFQSKVEIGKSCLERTAPFYVTAGYDLDDDLLDMDNKPLKLTFTFEQISHTFIYSPEVPQSSQGLTKSSKFSRDKVNLSSIYRLFHRVIDRQNRGFSPPVNWSKISAIGG